MLVWRTLMTLALAAAGPPRLVDLDGRTVDPFVHGQACLFVFVGTDCPVSNRYAPELARLHARFQKRGVRFRLVYPGDTPPDAIRHHAREYAYPFAALRDPGFSFTDAVGAQVTPEAALFDARGRLQYLGRIDDRYISVGRARPAPTTHDLEAAIEALLAGRPIATPRPPAVGCLIADLRGHARRSGH